MASSRLKTERQEGSPSALDRLAHTALLTAEEEVRLARRAQAGCRESRGRLVESNMRLVMSIARQYATSLDMFEDLVQEGAIGLMRSVDRYDPSMGYRFSTYATHWIRQAIGRAGQSRPNAIRLPAHVSQMLRRISRARHGLAQTLHREPTLEELSERAGIEVGKVRHLLAVSQDALSLDAPETAHLNVRDLDGSHDPEAETLRECLAEQIREVLSHLSPKEQYVIEWRMRRHAGMQEEEDVCDSLAVSRERVRQLEQSAIKKLRRLAQRRLLGAFLGP
jgi:RNA polymerase primary sigma factor